MTQRDAIDKLDLCGRRTSMLLITLQSHLPFLRRSIEAGDKERALEVLKTIEHETNITDAIIRDEQGTKGQEKS